MSVCVYEDIELFKISCFFVKIVDGYFLFFLVRMLFNASTPQREAASW